MFDVRMSGCPVVPSQELLPNAMLSTNRARTQSSNRKYRLAWLLIIASGLVALFVTWAAAYRITELASSGKEYMHVAVVVQKGDSLWSLAVNHGPRGWDPRKTVHYIAEMNRIHPETYAQLKPGHTILMPTCSRNAEFLISSGKGIRVVAEAHNRLNAHDLTVTNHPPVDQASRGDAFRLPDEDRV